MIQRLCSIVLICFLVISNCWTEKELEDTRNEIEEMFFHGYNNYLKHAYPHDELKPLTCGPRIRANENRGHIDDTLGNFSLTLVDSLDTLVVMGEIEEFEKGLKLLKNTLSFDTDVTISLFETTIRVLGGLLSIHLLAEQHSDSFSEPYQGEFLTFATDLGDRLLPAFNTPTGIPWSRINLKRGVMPDETLETCTAGAGTLLIEFGTLSRLTGNHIYEEKAMNALKKLWHYRSNLDLVGNVINIASGKWVHPKSSIGAGADSFYEYLLKAYILFGTEELFEMFNKSYIAIEKHNRRGGWYLDVNMHSGELTGENIDSLQAFWPAVQVLCGDINRAVETHNKLHIVSKSHGFLPEVFNIKSSTPLSHAINYPLRPELAESTLYLYQATKDEFYLNLGKEMVDKLQTHSRVPCGFASISNIVSKDKEDRMDSFFLSETLKYLYLLFDPENVFNKREYIYSTEGHPFPLNKLLQRDGMSSKMVVDDDCFCNAIAEEHLFDMFEAEQPVSTPKDHCVPASAAVSNPIHIEIVNKQSNLPMIGISLSEKIDGIDKFYGTPASFGPPFTTKGLTNSMVAAKPYDACSKLENEDMNGRIAILQRGSCPFADKVRNAQEAGAIAVIVVNDREGNLFTMSAEATDITIPSVLISLKHSKLLLDNVDTMTVVLEAAASYDLKNFLTSENTFITLDPRDTQFMSKDHVFQWISQEMQKLGFNIPADALLETKEP